MRATEVRRPLLLVLAVGFVSAVAIPAPTLVAQSGGVTISTDQPRYQVGDTAHVCYSVAGPGPVTIVDTQPNGSSHVFLSVDDDGTGYCLDGAMTPPAGTECLLLTASTAGATGSSNTCFLVVAQAPSSDGNGGIATDCGQVSVLGPPGSTATNSGSQAAEDCFYQAYQQCTPVTLEVSISAVDAGIRHTFTLQGSGGSCTITDAQQHFVVPRPPQPAVTTTCGGLSRATDGGLLVLSCDGNDVVVPPGM